MTEPQLTHAVLLDRWAHITEARKVPFKHWHGALAFWSRWMRKLLDSPQAHRCPDELRPIVEAELKWALADLTYLTTLTYTPPTDAGEPPSLAKRNGKPHPFIHIHVARKHTKPRKQK